MSILSGVVCGEYLFITLPLLSIKNLVKFHLIASDPITPLASFFKCLKNKITSVDILGFEYEMGLFPTIQEEAKSKGLRLSYKQIPMEVFDKRAVSRGEVIFHDVAYIEFKPHFNGNKLSVELT